MSTEKTSQMKKEPENVSSGALNHVQRAISVLLKNQNLLFEDRIGIATYTSLSEVLGKKIVDSVEAYMNELDLSLYSICNHPEAIAEELTALFGQGADFIVDSILSSAFDAIGVDSEESYTRFDLAHGLQQLREISESAYRQNGGEQ